MINRMSMDLDPALASSLPSPTQPTTPTGPQHPVILMQKRVGWGRLRPVKKARTFTSFAWSDIGRLHSLQVQRELLRLFVGRVCGLCRVVINAVLVLMTG